MRLVLSEVAARAIVEQAEYYEAQSGTALAARWESAVADTILSLQSFPERGARRTWREPLLEGLRSISIAGFPSHLLFYLCDRESSELRVVHVLHGARDLKDLLGDDYANS